MTESYADFLEKKGALRKPAGFKPLILHDFLFPFQRDLVEWAIKIGRGALFESCGMGKTPQFLSWADNIVRKHNKPVLILTPLAVAPQTVREGEKFGIEVKLTRVGKVHKGINVTNWQRMHYYNPTDFIGIVGDESGCLKSDDSQTKKAAVKFFAKIPYRLLCTATPAPNDHMELGSSSETLGVMGRNQMLGMFFTNDGESTSQWRLKGHAKKRFWQWMAGWARAVRSPSDLGYDDGDFRLPPLEVKQHVVRAGAGLGDGFFSKMAGTLGEQRTEKRSTLESRCIKAASLVPKDRPCILWCQLNAEGDLLERLIPGSVQVSGADSDEWKEKAIEWFTGNRCICQLNPKQHYGNLEECGKKNTKKTDDESETPTQNTRNVSRGNAPEPRRKTGSTCGNTMPPTSTDGKNALQKSKQSTTQQEEKTTKRMRNYGKESEEKSRSGKSEIPERDSHNDCERMESPSKNMKGYSPSKAGDAESAAAKTPKMGGRIDSSSIIATRRDESEDCSARHATSESASSETILGSSRKQFCTCGYTTGRRVLISKASIFGFGLNLQCCSDVVYFPSWSHEQYYQAVRRCWRFGQKRSVICNMIYSEGELLVVRGMLKKERDCEAMYAGIVREMNNPDALKNGDGMRNGRIEVPKWLLK